MKKDNPSKVIIVPHPPVTEKPDSTKKSQSPASEEKKEDAPEKSEETKPEIKSLK